MSKVVLAKKKSEEVEFIVDDDFYFPNSIHIANTGYPAGRFNNKVVLIHRYIMGAKKGETVDHINGNKLDNRRENLRITSQKNNVANVKYKGYYYCKDRNKYRSTMHIGKNRIHVGDFNTPKEAHEAYKKKHVEIHGEFSPWKDEVNEYSKEASRQA